MYKKIYFYNCEWCKKKRQTFRLYVSVEKVCSKCKRTRVSENQTNIFDAIKNVNNAGGNLDNSK